MTLEIVPLPCAVENLEHDEVCIRRHAGVLRVRVVAVARDDAGDVRTVSIIVVRRRDAVDEIDEGRDALVAEGVRAARAARQVVVPRRDAGVDDRNADARAGVTERLLNGPRTDRDRGAVVVLERRPIVVDAKRARIRRQAAQQTVRQIENRSVQKTEVAVASGKAPERSREFSAGLPFDDDASRAGRFQTRSDGSVRRRVCTDVRRHSAGRDARA